MKTLFCCFFSLMDLRSVGRPSKPEINFGFSLKFKLTQDFNLFYDVLTAVLKLFELMDVNNY